MAVWDPIKAQANRRKHGVRFFDAEGVLLDPNAITVDDDVGDERRFVSIGLDVVGRIVVVVYMYPRRGRTAHFSAARDAERKTAI